MGVINDVDFTGKTVIITGGTMGLGEGCARVFCAAGANVVVCARGTEAGKKITAELCDEYGEGKCTFIRCDVTKEEDIKNVVQTTVDKFGRLDCMLNNAGYHPPEENIDDVSGEMFEELLRLNLVSIFLFCKYTLSHLRKTKGNIINMSSLVGSMGQSQAVRYVATKGGITALTKALAVDEGQNGVRVNCISPGSIDSPLTMAYFDAMEDPGYEFKKICECSHLGRIGTIREVASVCLFLASELASFITGADIPVSGGAELGYGLKKL
ncbi:MAG: glucose 1-dehydrogenase [Eubacteriales bacterium]|nr:glucose 1-dehydrogenase [Eubacteriales bacterium]